MAPPHYSLPHRHLHPDKMQKLEQLAAQFSGYWEIGNVIMPRIPSITMMMEITVESTGLSIRELFEHNIVLRIYNAIYKLRLPYFNFEVLASANTRSVDFIIGLILSPSRKPAKHF